MFITLNSKLTLVPQQFIVDISGLNRGLFCSFLQKRTNLYRITLTYQTNLYNEILDYIKLWQFIVKSDNWVNTKIFIYRIQIIIIEKVFQFTIMSEILGST